MYQIIEIQKEKWMEIFLYSPYLSNVRIALAPLFMGSGC